MKKALLFTGFTFIIASCGPTGRNDESGFVRAEYFYNDSLAVSEIARTERIVTIRESDTLIIGRIAEVSRLDDRFLILAEVEKGSPLLIFSQSGRPLRRVGIRGRGPQEIERFRSHTYNVSGNTIEIFDSAKKMVHVYDTTGKYISGIPFGISPDDFSVTADGRYLLYMLTTFTMEGHDKMFPGVYLFGADGEYIKPLFSLNRPNYHIHSSECFMGIQPVSWLTAFDDNVYSFDGDTAKKVMEIDFAERAWPAQEREALRLFDQPPFDYIFMKAYPIETKRYISFVAFFLNDKKYGSAIIDKKEMTCRMYPGIKNDISGGSVSFVGSSDSELYSATTRVIGNTDQVTELHIFRTR